jgi:nucleotide-binding universal stress UspA family protein
MRRKPGSDAPFESVLCPVDFSSCSRTALRLAAAVARQADARLTVLFVNDPLLLAAAGALYHRRGPFVARANRELRRFVERALRSAPPAFRSPRCEVAAGNPIRVISATAARSSACLIVMGTHGLGGIRKLVVGSTTAGVLSEASAPVLAVPERHTLAWPPDRVIALINLSVGASQEARQAGAIAAWVDADLQLVSVLPESRMPRWLRPRPTRRIRSEEARTTMARLRRALTGLRVRSQVLVGEPGRDAALAAAARGNGLIVLPRSRPGGPPWKPGFDAYDIARRSRKPVLAFPPRRRTGT